MLLKISFLIWLKWKTVFTFKNKYKEYRGGSRNSATSKIAIVCTTLVNGFLFYVSGFLDPPPQHAYAKSSTNHNN